MGGYLWTVSVVCSTEKTKHNVCLALSVINARESVSLWWNLGMHLLYTVWCYLKSLKWLMVL